MIRPIRRPMGMKMSQTNTIKRNAKLRPSATAMRARIGLVAADGFQIKRSPRTLSIAVVPPSIVRVSGTAKSSIRTNKGMRRSLRATGFRQVRHPIPSPMKQTTRIVFCK